jgi:hypothetical protein
LPQLKCLTSKFVWTKQILFFQILGIYTNSQFKIKGFLLNKIVFFQNQSKLNL